jgi:hypothetical protein
LPKARLRRNACLARIPIPKGAVSGYAVSDLVPGRSQQEAPWNRRRLAHDRLSPFSRAERAGFGGSERRRNLRKNRGSRPRSFRRCTGRLNATQPAVRIAFSTSYIRGMARSCKGSVAEPQQSAGFNENDKIRPLTPRIGCGKRGWRRHRFGSRPGKLPFFAGMRSSVRHAIVMDGASGARPGWVRRTGAACRRQPRLSDCLRRPTCR